jgi:hypothetical protein
MRPTTVEVIVGETEEPIDGNAQLQLDILQNIQAVAWTVRPDGRMDFINRFYLEATGLSLKTCIAPLPSWNKGQRSAALPCCPASRPQRAHREGFLGRHTVGAGRDVRGPLLPLHGREVPLAPGSCGSCS